MGGRFGRANVLLLTVTGRKSGRRLTAPLLYAQDGDDLIVIASAGGSDSHPSWWLNLKTHPTAWVETRGERRTVLAEEAGPEEKRRLWPLMTRIYPPYDRYQRRTDRVIPLIKLRRLRQGTGPPA